MSDTETIAEAAAEDLDAARPVQMPLPGTGKALTLDAGGEPPDSAEVKIVGGAIPLAGQFDKGDEIEIIVRVRCGKVEFVDKVDSDGYVVGTTRRHVLRMTSCRRASDEG